MWKTFVVPKHAVGKVIGRGGKTIDEIAKVTACKLEFRRTETRENGDVPLRMKSKYNDIGDLSKADEMVQKIVS